MIELTERQMDAIAGGDPGPGKTTTPQSDKYTCGSPGIVGVCVTGSGEVIFNIGVQTPGIATGWVISPNTTASDFQSGLGISGHAPFGAGGAVAIDLNNGTDNKVAIEVGTPGVAITYGATTSTISKSVNDAVDSVKATANRIVEEASNWASSAVRGKNMDSPDSPESNDYADGLPEEH